MYYLYALIITLILFVLINKHKNNETLTVDECLTFFMIFIVSIFVVYLLSNWIDADSSAKEGGGGGSTVIRDNIKTGLKMY